ncbi:NUDIX domain-containing protein [Nocardioides panzhihuensis]|uniref:ADP-ribose pyrophosphatase n=1 Tax=Nocardioides panzhihuensis TaxID=860243 RepID=A0A7Z0DKY6_9ACTN|nr:NUDIX hydrolase [Nocardioides panzhihuensis]NYI77214.1 ADP-ribose pyrophosphatase [Nocardioides panzhihuensis]
MTSDARFSDAAVPLDLDPLTEWDGPESWPIASSEDLHRDGWVVALRADRINRPGHEDEEPFRRLVVEHPGAAVVLALDEEERALVITQYRHPAKRRFVELPAGLIDYPGEDPLDVAVRELREEVAHEASEWTHLLSTYASPGISEEIHHFYLARGLTATDRDGFVLEHEEAEMSIHRVPFEELLDAVLSGRATDSPVVQAVLAYAALKSRGRV